MIDNIVIILSKENWVSPAIEIKPDQPNILIRFSGKHNSGKTPLRITRWNKLTKEENNREIDIGSSFCKFRVAPFDCMQIYLEGKKNNKEDLKFEVITGKNIELFFYEVIVDCENLNCFYDERQQFITIGNSGGNWVKVSRMADEQFIVKYNIIESGLAFYETYSFKSESDIGKLLGEISEIIKMHQTHFTFAPPIVAKECREFMQLIKKHFRPMN